MLHGVAKTIITNVQDISQYIAIKPHPAVLTLSSPRENGWHGCALTLMRSTWNRWSLWKSWQRVLNAENPNANGILIVPDACPETSWDQPLPTSTDANQAKSGLIHYGKPSGRREMVGNGGSQDESGHASRTITMPLALEFSAFNTLRQDFQSDHRFQVELISVSAHPGQPYFGYFRMVTTTSKRLDVSLLRYNAKCPGHS